MPILQSENWLQHQNVSQVALFRRPVRPAHWPHTYTQTLTLAEVPLFVLVDRSIRYKLKYTSKIYIEISISFLSDNH